jgi:hypothetical protein
VLASDASPELQVVRHVTDLLAAAAATCLLGCGRVPSPPGTDVTVGIGFARGGTVVLSDADGRYFRHVELGAGEHRLTRVPLDGRFTRVQRDPSGFLWIQTIVGVPSGGRLWPPAPGPQPHHRPVADDHPRGTIEVRYTNTTTWAEAVELYLYGWHDGAWAASGDGVGTGGRERVAPGATARQEGSFDERFYEGAGVSVRRLSFFGALDPVEASWLWLRRPVPAPGVHDVVALTGADLPGPVPQVTWDPATRQVSVGPVGAFCADVQPDAVVATLDVRFRSGDDRGLHWAVSSPPSDRVDFPRLDPDEEAEVAALLAAPDVREAVLEVHVVADGRTYDAAWGTWGAELPDGVLDPDELGPRACTLNRIVRLR